MISTRFQEKLFSSASYPNMLVSYSERLQKLFYQFFSATDWYIHDFAWKKKSEKKEEKKTQTTEIHTPEEHLIFFSSSTCQKIDRSGNLTCE